MRFQLAENPKAMYSNSKSHSLYRKEADTSMAKLAVLVPHQDMLALAERVFDGYPKLQRAAVEYVRTEDAARRARELEADGCDIIMARGLQAALMKHAVRLPIIEIRSSAVELGRLMLDIREELKDPCPGIAVIGFANMLCMDDAVSIDSDNEHIWVHNLDLFYDENHKCKIGFNDSQSAYSCES